MILYHFHFSEDGESDLDTRGMEFPSAAAANADALRYAGGMIRDRTGRNDPESAWLVDVVDDMGVTLFPGRCQGGSVPGKAERAG